MTKSLILFLLVILVSCKTKNTNIEMQKKILGEWFLVHDSFSLSHVRSRGYTFLPNNTVEVKPGFYQYIYAKDESFDNLIEHFVGRNTKYWIEQDSLKVFSLSDSVWQSRRILSISDDTLQFQVDCHAAIPNGPDAYCYVEKFAKQHFQQIDAVFKFDKISVSSSGCYGSCPILKINIFSNGKIEFYGKKYTTKKGYFLGKISSEKYNELANNFRKVNLSTLSNKFEASHSDDSAIYISFWQDGKLIKAVRDYARESPSAFVCAYSQLATLYQEIDLTPIDENFGKKQFHFTPDNIIY